MKAGEGRNEWGPRIAPYSPGSTMVPGGADISPGRRARECRPFGSLPRRSPARCGTDVAPWTDGGHGADETRGCAADAVLPAAGPGPGDRARAPAAARSQGG